MMKNRLFSAAVCALPLLLAACESSSNAPARLHARIDAVEPPPAPAPAPAAIASETLQGTIGEVTSDSRNFPHHFTLSTANGPTAINVPDILADAFALTTKPGEAITAVVGTTTTDGGQSAYLLLSFTTAAGVKYAVPASASRTYARVEGTISAVARDKKGNPTTLLLSSGHIVRLNAKNTRSPEIVKDEPFVAEGTALPLAQGRMIVQASAMNGVALRLNLPAGGWGKRVEGDVGDEGGEEMMDGGDFGGGDAGGGE